MNEGFLPKGKLIYEVPEEDYLRWRKKDLFSLYVDLFCLFGVLIVGAFLITSIYNIEGFAFFFCFYVAIIIFGGFLIFSNASKNNARARLFRLRIYENGFEPSIRYNPNSESEKPVFIRFDDIIDAELKRHGYDIILKLKDGSKIKVESRWNVKGYMILHKMFRELYPDPSLPDIETLSRYLIAHEKLIKKEITKKEFLPYLEDWVKDTNRRADQEDSGGD